MSWPPRHVSPLDCQATDGPRVVAFIERYCRSPKVTIASPAGQRLALRPWQRSLLDAIYARRPDGRRQYRQALVGMPRKSGKSALASGVALYGLLTSGEGAEIYSAAADRDQARIVFGVARRMTELDPALSRKIRCLRYSLEVATTGSVYRALSAEAFTKEGLSPNLVVVDELHAQPNDELYNVLSLGSGARVDPLLLSITTAGVRYDRFGRDTLAHRMYQHGRKVASGEVEDPSFLFAWWEAASADADHTDPETWRQANPGFGDLVDPEDLASTLARVPEAEFRTKRLNQWVTASKAWLAHGAWEACREVGEIADGSTVVLALDGSWTGDSTALVACTTGDEPRRLAVLGHWERPDAADPHWRIPAEQVEATVLAACRRYQVVEVACDPFSLQRSMSVLEGQGVPIVEYPNTAARMVPASNGFYEAVLGQTIVHDGHAALARHVGNAVTKVDPRGVRLTKDQKGSGRRIDLAVAAVMAHDRAGHAVPAFTGAYVL